jgi:hypothetical protein
VNKEAEKMAVELVELFIEEAIQQSLEQARSENCNRATADHFIKILPRLMLDF